MQDPAHRGQSVHQACAKARWQPHAYVTRRNHYHLAVETPGGNLVEGMRWLQAIYASVHMGAPAALSRYVAEGRRGDRPERRDWLKRISKSKV